MAVNTLCMDFNLLAQQTGKNWLEWSELPPLPDTLGLGGAIIGESNGALLVAGGSNFNTPTSEGGTKRYMNEIYIFDKDPNDKYKWENVGRLPYPVSNGASVTTASGPSEPRMTLQA
jgi:solute:Na+ symporter, SSS family